MHWELRMTRDSGKKLQVLTYAATEPEAAMIIASLDQANIIAVAEGALTSALRAEVPGEIRVLVHRNDLDRAKAVLAEYQQEPVDVDWSNVDFGEQE